jgi:hypothetical protein
MLWLSQVNILTLEVFSREYLVNILLALHDFFLSLNISSIPNYEPHVIPPLDFVPRLPRLLKSLYSRESKE